MSQLESGEFSAGSIVSKATAIDGKDYYSLTKAQGVYDSNGDLLEVEGTIIPLTEPVYLDGRQQMYSNVIESSQDYFLLVDKHNCIQMVNRAYREIIDLPEESIVGSNVQSLWGFEKQSELYFEACNQGFSGHTGSYEFWAKLPGSGNSAYLEVNYYPVYEGDVITSLAFVIKDVTDRKREQEKAKKTESFLRGAQRSAEIGFWEVEIDTGNIKLSEVFSDLLGVSEPFATKSYLKNPFMEKFIHPDDLDEQQQLFAEVFQNKAPFTSEFRAVVDNRVKYMNVHGDAVADTNDCVTKFVGSIRDVTSEVLARKALAESEERYRLLYDDNPVMCFTIDHQGLIQQINSYCAMHLGFEVSDLQGKPFASIIHDEDISLVDDAFAYCFDSPEEVSSWEIRMICKSGKVLWTRDTAKVVVGTQSEKSLLVVAHDITENYTLSEQLVYFASHDSLTGLLNRREFEHRIQTTLDLARVEKSDHALCYLDLDQFKIINDTSGHMAGDELLIQICRVISGSVREQDAVARLGGDEFGVLLQYCSLEKAARIAEDIRKKIEAYSFDWDDKNYRVRASIGVTAINQSSAGLVDVVRQADNACYAAKDAGKNKVHIFHSEDKDLSRISNQLQWVTRLEKALRNDSFLLYAQPIASGADTTEGDRFRYEVLLRGVDKQGKLIPPSDFLPAAERYNLSDQIDIWVVDKVLSYLEKNPRHLERLSSCSINLSGRSFVSEKFAKFLLQRLKGSFVPSEKICFEITETAAIENLRLARVFIDKLKGLGCLIALDDFGSGLSSFGYLKSLPVDYLKIDGMFVKGIVEEPIDFAMVKSINEIGKVMGKKTVAEFVENEQIAERLRSLGVDFLQGYHIGKPLPIDELR